MTTLRATDLDATPRARIAAACVELGEPAIASACRSLLDGRVVDDELVLVLGGRCGVAVLDGRDREYWLRVWGARGLLYAWDDAVIPALRRAVGDESWRVREMVAKVVARRRIEEMAVAELMQSLEMGQKSCRLSLRRGDVQGELYFSAGQCKDARLGELEGDPAVYQLIHWTEGDFEIDFGASSDRETTTRSTTGLLMEAMRLLDEENSNRVEQ